MYKADILLFNCRPLSARLSKAACETARQAGRKMQFNNDQEGDPFKYEKCRGCSGLTGKGEYVAITAGDPRAQRVAVFTIDGAFGYV